jgi:phytoene dehydrogenase-like protein
LDRYFENPDLISFLRTATNYHGIPSEKTSAFILLRYSFFKYGYHISKGGIQRFFDALVDQFKSHRGEVLSKHTVDRILIEDSHIIGVKGIRHWQPKHSKEGVYDA